MSSYVENYGFTKTLIKDNNRNIDLDHELKWIGDYDGNKAHIKLDINDNGNKELVSMELDNEDLINILGMRSIQMPLEQRLSRDFLGHKYAYKPIVLEGTLIKSHTRKRRKHHRKTKKRRRTSKR